MRTQRRPLAFAATMATALFGVGLVAGATPAAAAAQDITSCGSTSIRADGSLDVDYLQVCLDQVQASLTFDTRDEADEADAAPADEAPADEASVIEEPVATAEPEAFDALDAVFAIEVTLSAPAEEVAPIDEGLGGAFAALAECESGGNYSINTGNGYYGAYQFSLSTWQGLGYGGYPHQASPAVQDQAARELQSLYGWGQWPGCSWYLGL